MYDRIIIKLMEGMSVCDKNFVNIAKDMSRYEKSIKKLNNDVLTLVVAVSIVGAFVSINEKRIKKLEKENRELKERVDVLETKLYLNSKFGVQSAEKGESECDD